LVSTVQSLRLDEAVRLLKRSRARVKRKAAALECGASAAYPRSHGLRRSSFTPAAAQAQWTSDLRRVQSKRTLGIDHRKRRHRSRM